MKTIYITESWHIRYDKITNSLGQQLDVCYLYCGSCPYAYWHPISKAMGMVTPFLASDVPKNVFAAFKMYNWYKEMNNENY